MGYNTNLSTEQNISLNKEAGKVHRLYKVGKILRIVGLVLLLIGMATGIFSGSLFFFVLALFNPITWVGALLLAFGQYFISNWKHK